MCTVERGFETPVWWDNGVMCVSSAVWSAWRTAARGYWRSSDRWERIREDRRARCSCRRWWRRNGAPCSRPIRVSRRSASEMCVLNTAVYLMIQTFLYDRSRPWSGAFKLKDVKVSEALFLLILTVCAHVFPCNRNNKNTTNTSQHLPLIISATVSTSPFLSASVLYLTCTSPV